MPAKSKPANPPVVKKSQDKTKPAVVTKPIKGKPTKGMC